MNSRWFAQDKQKDLTLISSWAVDIALPNFEKYYALKLKCLNRVDFEIDAEFCILQKTAFQFVCGQLTRLTWVEKI
jgi:hypothetical protein